MLSPVSLTELIAVVRRIPRAIRERADDRKLRRLLSRTPLRSLDDLGEDELGRFTGRVRPFEARLLEAPLSGRMCVYYDVEVDAIVSGAHASTLYTEHEAIPFVVEDAGSRATIDPAHARISATFDYLSIHDLPRPSYSAREADYLARHRIDRQRRFLIDGVRFREAILDVDELIAVVGAGVREPDPHAAPDTYRGTAHTWLRMIGTERYPLIISDDPRSLV